MKKDDLTNLKADIAAAEEKGDWRRAIELKSLWTADLASAGGADGRSPEEREALIDAAAALKTEEEKKKPTTLEES